LTVIVALPHRGVVYMGGDSAATCGYSRLHLVESKVWKQGDCVFGLTGGTREAQIIQHRLQVPTRTEHDDLLRWITVPFIDALRQARKDSGYDEKQTTGPEVGPHFLMGVEGRLFFIDSLYGIVEQPHGYAIGSGGNLAIGSLHTSRLIWKQPMKRLDAALKAACYNDSFCAPPFTFVNT
jgi:ATP-dependent protease HslVU (ClpYQ) peptidase subunit